MSSSEYSQYKESGVEWLGQIPCHWDVAPIKYAVSWNDEVLPENTDADYEIQYLEISDVELSTGIKGTNALKFGMAPSRARRKLRDGDVVISTVRTYLKAIAQVESSAENLIASTGFAVLRAREGFWPKFIGYAVQSERFVSEVISHSVGVSYPAINASDLVSINAALPPFDEQRLIAVFLDHETAKIDALVEEQKRLIELLAEKRKSMMAAAVCRGINVNAQLVDSGVEWLGKIPEHWKVLQTKRLFRLITDAAPDGDDSELLSIYTDIGVRPRKSLEERGNKSSTTDGYWKVKKGDLIVNKLLAWMGAIGVSEFSGVTSPAYDILRHEVHVSPHFYDILFRCGICHHEFKRYSRGIMEMRLRLYFEELGQLYMPCPPLDEQLKIVEHVRTLNDEMDKLAGEASRNITFLTERRASLISAAVTGKIDVRGFVAPQIQ